MSRSAALQGRNRTDPSDPSDNHRQRKTAINEHPFDPPEPSPRPLPRIPAAPESRGERRLAAALAPIGHAVRHMRYLGKWVVLGVLIGLAAGVAALVFYAAIRLGTTLFQGGIAGYVPPGPAGEGRTVVGTASRFWLLPLSTMLGGLLAGALVQRLAPEAEGHGTDAAIACFHQHAGYMRFRATMVKLVASAITLGSGGSGGREGPTAQIGAGFGSLLSGLLKLDARDRRIAVAAGIGAGIAAIFRAPLGGAVLSAELLYRRDFEAEALAPGLVSAIVAYTLFAGVVGWNPVFGNQPNLAFTHPIQLLYYAALGLVIGGFGILYIKTFYAVQRLFARVSLSSYLKPALGGLLVGLIGLGAPQAVGVGYGWVQFLMRPGQTAVPLLLILALPFLKILTTSLSIGSGGSGGIFGPGLVIGAGVGASWWAIFHGVLP
ncbi:MAG: chloride channel protein, partial [Chloroflexota bacterium]